MMRAQEETGGSARAAAARKAIGAALLAALIGGLPWGHAPAAEESGAARPEGRSAQQETVATIRQIGEAWLSWLSDQIGAAAAGQRSHDLSKLPVIEPGELERLLVGRDGRFAYLEELRRTDAWGHPLEFRYSGDPLAAHVMSIRSPGRDGVYEAETYPIGTFPSDELDRDLVWADGRFISRPRMAAEPDARPR